MGCLLLEMASELGGLFFLPLGLIREATLSSCASHTAQRVFALCDGFLLGREKEVDSLCELPSRGLCYSVAG